MDLVEKYMNLNEADFIDLTQAQQNIDNVMKVINTLEDWLNMAKTFVVTGKRKNAMQVSSALKKKSDLLDRLMKKIPNRKISKANYRRNKLL